MAISLFLYVQAHTECWLEYQGQLNGGTNPTYAEVKSEMIALSAQYDVPYEIIAAVCHVESAIRHYASDGKLLHNVPECKGDYQKYVLGQNVSAPNPPGLGIMQLTGSTAQAYDVALLRTDWTYNLKAGVSVLKGKYNTYKAWLPTVLKTKLDANNHLLENWYMPCWFYNGFTSGNSQVPNTYLNRLWNLPSPLPQFIDAPIWVTRAPDVFGAHFGYNSAGIGNTSATTPDFKFAAEADGTWTCSHSTTYSAAVTPTYAVPPAAPANLAAAGALDGPGAKVDFAWDAAPTADGYWLDLAESDADLQAMTGTFQAVFVGSATSHVWTGLAQDTTYFWRVYATNDFGGTHAYPSEPVTTPLEPPPPPPPPDPTPSPAPAPSSGGGGGGGSSCGVGLTATALDESAAGVALAMVLLLAARKRQPRQA